MPDNALMGVDVGTTFIKAVVYAEDLTPLGGAQSRTPWSAVSPGIEADPDALAETTIACIERAFAAAGEVQVRAIGITGMGETGVLADRHDRPVAPAIAWHDDRGNAEARALAHELTDFAERAGRRPDDRPSLVKWRWLAGAGYDLGRAQRWYSVPEWIARRLGGRPPSELSLASRTGVIDVGTAQPYAAGLEWSGADSGWFGEFAHAGASAGRVDTGPAGLIGAVVSVAGLDCYASALAIGADEASTALLSCGTSGAVVRVLTSWPDLGQAAAAGLTVDRYLDGHRPAVLGATPCGLVLQPLRDRLGEPGIPAASEWTSAYEAVAAAEGGLLAVMNQLFGDVQRIVAAGGWIEHPGLRAALKRRLGDRLEARTDPTSAARGAAILARRALDAG
jgi:sugar (pentulose or hexulose) kinase